MEQYYFSTETEIIGGEIVPSITESPQCDVDNFPSVVQRFFKKHYFSRNDSVDEMHTVLHHSNRICLIGLADNHIAVRKGIQSINFDIGNCDRSKFHVKGKNKKGAMNMTSDSGLAVVTCVDGSEYKIVSAIQGKLIEVNDRLLLNPKHIGKDGIGYIAIILPKIDKYTDIVAGLLTEDEYQERTKNIIE